MKLPSIDRYQLWISKAALRAIRTMVVTDKAEYSALREDGSVVERAIAEPKGHARGDAVAMDSLRGVPKAAMGVPSVVLRTRKPCAEPGGRRTGIGSPRRVAVVAQMMRAHNKTDMWQRAGESVH